MPEFEKQWSKLGLTDQDLKDLEAFLCEHPDSGDLIKGTGGLRKLRWALPSGGKSGGARVLYVDFASFEQTFLITCFKKAQKVNLSKAECNAVKEMIQELHIGVSGGKS